LEKSKCNLYLHSLFGGLAQLVQSICLTSRGSAVRTRQPPQPAYRPPCGRFLFLRPLKACFHKGVKTKTGLCEAEAGKLVVRASINGSPKATRRYNTTASQRPVSWLLKNLNTAIWDCEKERCSFTFPRFNPYFPSKKFDIGFTYRKAQSGSSILSRYSSIYLIESFKDPV
jgi:hypothetical protein